MLRDIICRIQSFSLTYNVAIDVDAFSGQKEIYVKNIIVIKVIKGNGLA